MALLYKRLIILQKLKEKKKTRPEPKDINEGF